MKTRIAPVALAICMAMNQAAADMPEPQAGAENPHAVAGRKAIEARDYQGAVGHLTKAAEAEASSADIHSMLGYAYRKTKVFDKSMEHYQRALRLDAGHRSAHEYLGELYLDLNQPDKAEKQLAALKKACPFFGKCKEYEDLKRAFDAYQAKKK